MEKNPLDILMDNIKANYTDMEDLVVMAEELRQQTNERLEELSSHWKTSRGRWVIARHVLNEALITGRDPALIRLELDDKEILESAQTQGAGMSFRVFNKV